MLRVRASSSIISDFLRNEQGSVPGKMTWNPALGELRGCPQDVRSRVEPHKAPCNRERDALFAPGLTSRPCTKKKRSIVGSNNARARIPGRRLPHQRSMTAREHELHGRAFKGLPHQNPICVNNRCPPRWREWHNGQSSARSTAGTGAAMMCFLRRAPSSQSPKAKFSNMGKAVNREQILRILP